MIGTGHAELWARYAGQVDMMVITSCPARGSDPVYHLADGKRLIHDDMGPLLRPLKGTADRVFGETIDRQTAWLGVPAVNSAACGQITTEIPNGLASLRAPRAATARQHTGRELPALRSVPAPADDLLLSTRSASGLRRAHGPARLDLGTLAGDAGRDQGHAVFHFLLASLR